LAARKRAETAEGQAVLFLDRCIDHADTAAALVGAGAVVERHVEYFDGACPDEVWLPDVAARGWAIVTKDRAIKRHPAEIQAWQDSGAAVFALASAQLAGRDGGGPGRRAAQDAADLAHPRSPPLGDYLAQRSRHGGAREPSRRDQAGRVTERSARLH